MAIDEAILTACQEGMIGPTVRFYSWTTPTISLGYFQKAREVLDLDLCQELKIDVVRRPTGGRAVFHEHEVTYSVIVPETDSLLAGTVVESYQTISRAFVKGLQFLGIDASMSSPLRRGSTAPLKKSPLCFSALSAYEVTVGDRKIIGSAQKRSHGVLLQHGSILIKVNLERLFSVLKIEPSSFKDRARREAEARLISIHESGEETLTYDDVCHAMIKGLQKELNIDLYKAQLTTREEEFVQFYKREKYLTLKWNFCR